MIPISIDDFALSYVKNNKEADLQTIKKNLQKAVKTKKSGAVCNTSTSNIWAIGSAVVGWNGCFSCITGETDSSEDYEIDTVNY